MRKRHKFNLSHVNSTTCKMGDIVPIMMVEALPGDTFQGDTKTFTRVAPLIAPVMHKAETMTATFYVPNRIMCPKLPEAMTGGPDGNDTTEFPYVEIAPTVGSLADYLGLPLSSTPLKVSALPFRAYAMIRNEYFRDQDLMDPVPVSLEPGRDTTTSTDLLKAAWAKDYFTTARPWPQKGEAINIPLGDKAPVMIDTNSNNGIPLFRTVDNSGTAWTPPGSLNITANDAYVEWGDSSNNSDRVLHWSDGHTTGLSAYLDNVSTVTVDELREAFALQRWQEKRSLYGSRYEDLLRFWGLNPQDSRLQHPELISVRRSLLQFSEVLQTTPNSDGSGVGNMAGHGVGASRTGRWRYYCHEHGWIITVMIVRPQAVYTQGIERHWTRWSRFDYWNPELQHIGQQEVLNKEVYADGSADDEEVFGYQNRYDEYRRGKNHVSGEFRTTLNYWNMARIFENRPALNGEFVTSNPTDRIFQLNESLSDQLYVMVQNDLVAKRLISRNGNPI